MKIPENEKIYEDPSGRQPQLDIVHYWEHPVSMAPDVKGNSKYIWTNVRSTDVALSAKDRDAQIADIQKVWYAGQNISFAFRGGPAAMEYKARIVGYSIVPHSETEDDLFGPFLRLFLECTPGILSDIGRGDLV